MRDNVDILRDGGTLAIDIKTLLRDLNLEGNLYMDFNTGDYYFLANGGKYVIGGEAVEQIDKAITTYFTRLKHYLGGTESYFEKYKQIRLNKN